MLSIQVCKKLLESKGRILSEEQVKKIRKILYQLAEIDYIKFKEVIKNAKESYYLHESFN